MHESSVNWHGVRKCPKQTQEVTEHVILWRVCPLTKQQYLTSRDENVLDVLIPYDFCSRRTFAFLDSLIHAGGMWEKRKVSLWIQCNTVSNWYTSDLLVGEVLLWVHELSKCTVLLSIPEDNSEAVNISHSVTISYGSYCFNVMVSVHTPYRCVKMAYWHSSIPNTPKCKTNTNKLDAISHSAKHTNNKSMWQQFCSICSLNVPSFQAHGQVKAQWSRQMDSLCGTRSCHICLEAAGASRL